MAAIRVGVLGPGGVGALLAALSAQQGADVTCIATQSTANSILENGISVQSDRFGSFRVDVRSESELSVTVDVLCVAVKATVLDTALKQLPLHILGNAVVVPFLNGVEHVALLRQRLEHATVVPATIRIESTRLTPGNIVQTSPFAKVEIAFAPSNTGRVTPFVDLLRHAGLDVAVRHDEWPMLWEKLSFLAPLALLTTTYDAPAGIIRSEHRRELEAVIAELSLVAQAEGVTIGPAETLALFDQVPAMMQSSMQRDAEAHRPIEIDAVGGAILRSASTHGIAVPVIERLVADLCLR